MPFYIKSINPQDAHYEDAHGFIEGTRVPDDATIKADRQGSAFYVSTPTGIRYRDKDGDLCDPHIFASVNLTWEDY